LQWILERVVADSRAVLTVLGVDRVGIVAGVTAVLAELQVNIEDIRMALMGEIFTMICMVNVAGCPVPFADLQAALEARGRDLGVQAMIQREETFRAMHRV
jgi:ACT domain-containing protein